MNREEHVDRLQTELQNTQDELDKQIRQVQSFEIDFKRLHEELQVTEDKVGMIYKK